MEFVPGLSARDLPEPPSVDEVAARFGAPVYTFVDQPALRESGAGTVGVDDVLVEISLSYSVRRSSGALDDPSDFRPDEHGALAAAIAAADQSDQPAWFKDRLREMRLPQLWEAVTTIRLGGQPDRLLAERLAGHVNHVVVNTMPHRRRRHPERMFELDAEVTSADAVAAPLLMDGQTVDGIRIDSDPDVVGWAAEHRGRAVLVVVAREHLPLVNVELVAKLPLEGRWASSGAPAREYSRRDDGTDRGRSRP